MPDYNFIFSALRKPLIASALWLVIAPGAAVNAAESATPTATTTTTTKTTKTVRRKHDATSPGNKTIDGKAGAGDVEAAADNTATNKRDRADRAVTADQQKNDKSDVELAAEIRRAVIDDKSLSTNAHNVKIIVVDGKVTLKGPVASTGEKATIERLAGQHAGHGKGRVTSEIEVAP